MTLDPVSAVTTRLPLRLAAAAVLLCGLTVPALAQAPPTSGGAVDRDPQGHATLHARRLTGPLKVDGVLDEAIYQMAPAASDFIETEPRSGAKAEEKTEAWIFYDDNNLYVVARCWETHPERRVANEMRRDNGGVLRGDHFAITLDTFHDHRSAVVLNVNPVGGRMDGQVATEGQYSGDWNPVWNVQTGRFDGGWAVEIAMPFKTLRYRPGADQTWGFNMRRRVIWNNEIAYLSAVPAGTGTNGTTRPSTFGTLVDIKAPPGARNVEVKPYVVSSLSTDKTSTPKITNDPSGDIGIDAKIGLTQSLTANVTVNTDFAQVEADEQQVNLTRFSLFFPEKREFFLENYGLFGFGGVAPTSGAGDVPIMFYSRRIGLNNGREVPIRGGGRLVGQVGRFTVGAINIESGQDDLAKAEPTNFTAVRLKRDILRRSSIGAIVTDRSRLQTGTGGSQTFGVDANFGFFTNLSMSAYYAKTESDRAARDNQSYRGQLNYNADRYGATAEYLVVGTGFSPEVGFLRRGDFQKSSGVLRFSPRPKKRFKKVRKFSYTGTYSRLETRQGRRDTETWEGEFNVERQNTDTFEVAYGGNYELLVKPFTIAPRVVVPVGGYDTNYVRGGYNFGRQRPLSGNVTAQYGTFYTGHITTVGVASGRVNVSNQISIEPSLSLNRVTLVQGNFTTRLIGTRTTYTLTPQMFVSALVQYNSSTHALSTNARLRWEYRPGSEFFLVYNDSRGTLTPGFPDLTNRALVVKVNRLLNF